MHTQRCASWIQVTACEFAQSARWIHTWGGCACRGGERGSQRHAHTERLIAPEYRSPRGIFSLTGLSLSSSHPITQSGQLSPVSSGSSGRTGTCIPDLATPVRRIVPAEEANLGQVRAHQERWPAMGNSGPCAESPRGSSVCQLGKEAGPGRGRNKMSQSL